MRGRAVIGTVMGLALGTWGLGPAWAGGAGSPDLSFSGDGRATVDFNPHSTREEARDVVVKDNGKVVTVGVLTTATGSRFAISRLTASGRPDRTFSDNGRQTTAFPGVAAAAADRVVALPGGKILVAGVAGDAFALARYLANGDLDTSFGGGDGKVVTDVTRGYDAVRDVRVDADGTILVAGFAGDGFASARYLADGTPDPAYGVGGILTTTGVVPGSVAEVRLDRLGRMVVAGQSGPSDDSQFLVGRYDVAGHPDSGFGTGGWTTIRSSAEEDWGALTLAVQPDGPILVGGYAFLGDYENFALARLGEDGAPDPTFGENGTTEHLVGNAFYAKVHGLAVQADGRILAVGWVVDRYDSFAVSRYTADGKLDTTFSKDGMVRTRLVTDRPNESQGYAVAVAAGTVVAAGISTTAGDDSFGIVRYHAG